MKPYRELFSNSFKTIYAVISAIGVIVWVISLATPGFKAPDIFIPSELVGFFLLLIFLIFIWGIALIQAYVKQWHELHQPADFLVSDIEGFISDNITLRYFRDPQSQESVMKEGTFEVRSRFNLENPTSIDLQIKIDVNADGIDTNLPIDRTNLKNLEIGVSQPGKRLIAIDSVTIPAGATAECSISFKTSLPLTSLEELINLSKKVNKFNVYVSLQQTGREAVIYLVETKDPKQVFIGFVTKQVKSLIQKNVNDIDTDRLLKLIYQ